MSENPFSHTESDKVIENDPLTEIKKTPGGTTGFSVNANAVKRWEINSSYRASLRSVVQKHKQISTKAYMHKDVTDARITKDESDIQAILAVLQESFVNPFSDQQLLSI